MTESSHLSRFTFYRYLITGGCGFIGTSLIAHLLKKNPDTKIRVLDNLTVGSREDLSEVCNFMEADVSHLTSHVLRSPEGSPSSVELIIGDIRDYETCLKCCEGIDVVVHLAANTGVPVSVEKPRMDMECNVIGTFNMLEGARTHSVKRFIFASSGAPAGEVEPPIHEELAPHPVSPYGASKLAGEGYCSAYYRIFGLKTVTLRFGNVYGPRSKHKSSVVAKFFKLALAGETLEIYGDGNQTRDFIYIDDLIQAICLAVAPMPLAVVSSNVSRSPDVSDSPNVSHLTSHVSRPSLDPWGEVFQIATYKETTVNEIAGKIKEIVEKEIGKKVDIFHAEARLGDVRRNFSDITKAKQVLGYEPLFSLDKGLMLTFAYFSS